MIAERKRKGESVMARNLDDFLRDKIKTELDSLEPDMDGERRLIEIHKKCNQRSGHMKLRTNKLAAAFMAVAVITVLGTVTAVASGKITRLISSSNNTDSYTIAQLREEALDQMKVSPKIPESLSSEMSFKEGYITNVKGLGDDNNQVLEYPEVCADYGNTKRVTLTSHVHQEALAEENDQAAKKEVYHNVTITVSTLNYLFLPPDQEPSAEDKKLEQEGKLMISYGSSEEERKVFKMVSWSENGIDYLLYTFDDFDLDSLSGMARGIIDMK